MSKTRNYLEKKIMRRVYYTCAIRLVAHPVVTHGVLLALCAGLLTQFVSFGSVLGNLSRIPVGRVPEWSYQALVSTEAWTLVLMAAIGFALISLRIQLRMMPRWLLA